MKIDDGHGNADKQSMGLRVSAVIFCLPISALGFLFGLRVLSPAIMKTWCTAYRGCNAVKLWNEYPDCFPSMALSFGVAFLCLAILVGSVRLPGIAYRLLGLGAVFGFVIPLYWLGILRVTDASTMSAIAFNAPFAVLLLFVLPIEISRFMRGKTPTES